MSMKIFDGDELPHDLLLTARQKLSQEIPLKIICQLIIGSLLSKIAGSLMKVAVPLAKNILAPLGITAVSAMQESKRKYMVLEQQH